MPEDEGLPAYPILDYQLIPDPDIPTVVALAFTTEERSSLFLATREILEDMAKGFLENAAKMPRRADMQ